MAKYDPAVARDARRVRAWMRRRLPGAVELIYDTYNWLVIGFGPTDRPSEAVFSIVLAPRWVTLCFLEGALLPDPHRILRGGGKQVRNIRLDDLRTLDRPEVMALIKQHGIKTAIVTNAAQPMALRDVEIEEHKLLQYFPDCRLSAADAGVLKPHPGIFQLAMSPLSLTSIAPKTVKSIFPALIIPKLSALSKKAPPGKMVTVSFPALIRSGSISSSVG